MNCIVPDPAYQEILYLATDVGVYYTINGGTSWQPAGTGMPVVTCVDLKLHQPTRTLVAGTYGRSVYKLNLDDLVGDVSVPGVVTSFSVFPNPITDGTAFLHFTIPTASLVRFTLQSYDGRIICSKNANGRTGKNTIAFDLKNAVAGVYLLSMQNGEWSAVQKVIVQ